MGFRFQRLDKLVGIPLTREPSAQEKSVLASELGSTEIHEADFGRVSARSRNLRDSLLGKIPSSLLGALPRSLDIIGDIAITELSPQLDSYSSEVGTGILQVNPNIRLVLKKASDVTGTFRTREFKKIAGFGGTETIHREFGCKYHLNVTSTYFNPRLGNERRRVADQVSANDVVVDMFAGVGPYSILIAKLQRARIYSIDINPSAVDYLKENILSNEVAEYVTPYLGDARVLSMSMLRGTADRVVMNLPSEAESFLDAASLVLRPTGGRLHFYEFAQRGVNLDTLRERFNSVMSSRGRNVKKITECKIVREISPSRIQIAIDALVE